MKRFTTYAPGIHQEAAEKLSNIFRSGVRRPDGSFPSRTIGPVEMAPYTERLTFYLSTTEEAAGRVIINIRAKRMDGTDIRQPAQEPEKEANR